MTRKTTDNFAENKPSFGYSLMFSSASILGITITTGIVFFVMWYFSIDKTIMLQNISVIKIFLLTLLIGTIITMILRRIFISPLIKLAQGMNKVASGDFSVRLECDDRRSDLKGIYASFNKMTKELSLTETLQTDFISNVSHEFKTPLGAIQGYASLLQESDISADKQRIYVDKIIFNTHRLSELVGNVLLLSKAEPDRIKNNLRYYRLDEQIRQSLLALESKWEPKEIVFDIELDEISYIGPEALMSHVWTNLIDNAVKFSFHGGNISLSLWEKNSCIHFRINNRGISIPENSLDRIFSKFYQCDTSHKSEGNGLGLPLAKMIVDACGGEIKVSSHPDTGTTFDVIIPTKIS